MSKQAIMKKRTILVPQYMRKFSCIGKACEDSCCAGWSVTLDENTYKKYNRIQDVELTPLFKKKINRIRSISNKDIYAKIKMDSNGICPFLTDAKLCNVQLKLGEEYLSKTCSTYPRILNEVNGFLERSATMSCPEAARLALLNPEKIEFDEVEELVNIQSEISKKIDTKLKSNRKAEKYFWELRIFTIQVLQNRSFSLGERLIMLGMFYNKLDDYIKSDLLDEIPHHIATYMNVIQEGSLQESLAKIPVQYVVQMKLAKELADKRFLHGINNQRYLDCFSEMLQGIHYLENFTLDEVMEQYITANEKYFQPFMKEHEYILENYLVNYVYKNIFPYEFSSVFDDYVMMVVHYAMIKLLLIGMSGFHQGLTIEQVIKLIQSFAKTVEHNQLYLRGILNLLKENGFTTMAYMSILIKN